MFAGVDTHKDTLAVAVIDHAGRVVRQLVLPNQDSGYVRLLALLTSHNVVRVGIEGSGNFGWPAAIYLLERDLNVVEVPREALRCLKRRLSDLIYRTLRADLATAAQRTPTLNIAA